MEGKIEERKRRSRTKATVKNSLRRTKGDEVANLSREVKGRRRWRKRGRGVTRD